MAFEYFLYRTDYNNTIVDKGATSFAPLPPNTGEIFTEFLIPNNQPLYYYKELTGSIVVNDDATIELYLGDTEPEKTNDSYVTYGELTGYTATTTVTAGITVNFPYKYSSDINIPPQSKFFELNNINATLATTLNFHYVNANQVDVSNVLLSINKGARIYCQNLSDADEAVLYLVTGDSIDNGTYVTFPVTLESSGVSSTFSNNQEFGFIVNESSGVFVSADQFSAYTATINSYTANTETRLDGIDSDVNYLSGQTASKLSTSSFNSYSASTLININSRVLNTTFNGYTGTTAPATYQSKSSINIYTGTTAPNQFAAKSNFDLFTGTTAPATYALKSQFASLSGSSTGETITTFQFHADASAALTLTNQTLAAAFLGNSNRNIVKLDLRNATQIKLLTRVVTASASVNTPRLILRYNTTFSTVATNYIDIGTSPIQTSMSAVGLIDSGWIDVTSLARAEVFVTVIQIGGDGAADPALGMVGISIRNLVRTGSGITTTVFNSYTAATESRLDGIEADIQYISGQTGSGGITTANNGLTVSGTNVRLGGTLTGDTTISGNTKNLSIGTNNSRVDNLNFRAKTETIIRTVADDLQESFINLSPDSFLIAANDNVDVYKTIGANNNNLELITISSSGNSEINLDAFGVINVISDGVGAMKYDTNYSSNFIPRSLVDKGYVTGITSTLVPLSTYNTYVNTTAPATYLQKTGGTISGSLSIAGSGSVGGSFAVAGSITEGGIPLSTKYNSTTNFNTYTGTTESRLDGIEADIQYISGQTGSGGVTGATNVGSTGQGIFKQLVSNNLEFKKISVGTNLAISGGTDTVLITLTGGSGGVQQVNQGTGGIIVDNTNPSQPVISLNGSLYTLSSNFNTYTGTTAPNQFASRTNFNTHTGTTVNTANNGLTKSGTNVRLGGTLTGATTVTSPATGSRLSFAGFPVQYSTDVSANFNPRSVVDKAYVTGITSSQQSQINQLIAITGTSNNTILFSGNSTTFNTTSTTPVSRMNNDFNIPATGTYLVWLNTIHGNNTSNRTSNIRLLVNDVQIGSDIIIQANSATNRLNGDIIGQANLTSGVNNIKVQIWQTGGGTAVMYYINVIIFRQS